ncbi:MAG: hypothetical protein M3139_05390 [Bacteroidota bacterium]|nr:hypothetical protein [Bacteroidota bacterium]
MERIVLTSSIYRIRQYKIAFILAILSIFFALLEGVFSNFYGYNDESFYLFGFGIGSFFIEVISAVGVARIITRIRQSELSGRSNFEKTALRITCTGLIILVAGLILTSIYNIYTKHKPETTLAGVIIAATSIILMLI